jgi:hypothetical protein
MTLAQMIASVDRKTYFSSTKINIIEAINSAAKYVYQWVLKENRGFFLKWDTSLTLTVGQQEYLMQDDLQQIIMIREYDPDAGEWRIIHSQDILDNGRMQQQFGSLVVVGGFDSPFRFYGPYIKSVDKKTYIKIEPAIDKARQLEIVYSSKYVEIQGEGDDIPFLMPEDSHDVIKDIAICEVLDDGDDDLSEKINARAQQKLTLYLTLVRSRQNQDTPRQEAYL